MVRRAGEEAQVVTLLPLTNWQRCARFGRPRFVPAPLPNDPEHVRLIGDWSARNIVRVYVPQLERFHRAHQRVHRLAAQPLIDVWQAWDDAGLAEEVETWNGLFVPRFKRGRAGGGIASLSNHGWGTAFDCDAHLYPLGRAVPLDAPVRKRVEIAAEYGWFWGGAFRRRPDGMHWEYAGAAS